MDIYIARGEEQFGPYPLEQVHQLLDQGALLPEDLAFHEGLENWTPLAEIIAAQTAPKLPSLPLPAVLPPAQEEPASPEPLPAGPSSKPQPASIGATQSKPKKPIPLWITIVVLVLIVGGMLVYGAWYVFFKPNPEYSPNEWDKEPPLEEPGISTSNNQNTTRPGGTTGPVIPPKPEPTPRPTPPSPSDPLARSILGKRLVCKTAEGIELILQFDKDGTFSIGTDWQGKFSQHRESVHYSIDNLKVKLSDNGRKNGAVTFPTDNPKEGDQISFGPEQKQITATILRIAPAKLFEISSNPSTGGDTATIEPSDPEPVIEPKKLTPTQVEELLAYGIGSWKMKGTTTTLDPKTGRGDAMKFEDKMETRWKEKGKATISSFGSGVGQTLTGTTEYDTEMEWFTWRVEGEGKPETVSKNIYDPATKTYHQLLMLPNDHVERGTYKRINKDKAILKSEIFDADNELMGVLEINFTRVKPEATEPTEPEPNTPAKKLTVKQASEVMAWEIGKWETKGQAKQLEGGLIETKASMECQWKKEGKSLEFQFTMTHGEQTMKFSGHKHYDVAKGVFVYRQWGEKMPESTSHEVYDLATKTYHGQSISPSNGPKTTTVTKRIGNDKTQQRLEVREGDQLVYSHDIISTREETENTEPKPDSLAGKIESPGVLAKRTLDALSKNDFPALSKLGAESLPKEVLIDTMVNLRYAATEENIKLTTQRRSITEEEAKEYLEEEIQKEKARMEGEYQEGMKQISAKRKMSFDRVIAEGKKQANIEWDKVSFVRLEGETFEKNGIKGGDFFIVLAHQGNNFKIKLDDCMHYPKHGWFLTHGPDWGDGTDAGPPDETSEGESSHEEPAQPEPAPNARAKGLVAYYPFNGNARNEAGNDHHGQVFGAKLTADRHGKVNSAYQFKPSDHIKINGLMGKPKNLTLSAWVKLDGQQGKWGAEIISLGVSASIRVDSKSTYPQRVGTGGITRMQQNGWMNTMAKFNYTGTGWHQIVFTFDDDANRQVTYIDGAQLALKENERSIVYQGLDKDTVIGIHGRSLDTFRSQGIIDDLRVYDRALNSREVKALFQSEKPAFPLQAGKEIKIATVTELRAKAQAGDPLSQLQLGLKFINGTDGLQKNPQATEKLWLRAAKQGNPMAQMNLGLLYSRGGLGKKNPVKAYPWAKLSLASGNQRAKQLTETLEKELTHEQITKADEFVKAFKPVSENSIIREPTEPNPTNP